MIVVVDGSNESAPPASVEVIAALIVMLGVPEAYEATVAPDGMPSPTTLTPAARFVFAAAKVITVVEGSKESAVVASVAVMAAESTIEGPPAVYDATVAPAGMPTPLTLTPAARFTLAAPSVTVVVAGSKATFPADSVAVIAALIVMLGVLAVYDATVAPAGIPQPAMLIPLTILASGAARVSVVVAGSTEIVVPLGTVEVVAADSTRVVPDVPAAAVAPAAMPVPLTAFPTAIAVPAVRVTVVCDAAVAVAVARVKGPWPVTWPAKGPWWGAVGCGGVGGLDGCILRNWTACKRATRAARSVRVELGAGWGEKRVGWKEGGVERGWGGKRVLKPVQFRPPRRAPGHSRRRQTGPAPCLRPQTGLAPSLTG